MQTRGFAGEDSIDSTDALIERRRATWGEYLYVYLPNGLSYECAFVDGTGVQTGDHDPQSALNRAVQSAGYESVEAHR